MEAASLARHRPHLQGVFGPLDKDQDSNLREVLLRVDQEILTLAKHLGRDRAGHEGTGLELIWTSSGQLSLQSHVDAGDRSAHAVTFSLELTPSWCYEEPSGVEEWLVYATIDADCQHEIDHESMDTVYDRGQRRSTTPAAAVTELLAAARELVSLGTSRPIEYWTALAKT